MSTDTQEKRLTVKQDAPLEYGRRGEIAALADRFAVMLPNAKDLSRDEILTAAQYARMMDLNPFRGEVYFYKDRGKLCVVDGYKALARWAKNKMPYSTRYENIEPQNGEAVHVRCWILRDDGRDQLREFKELGATFMEAYEMAADFADGVVSTSELTDRRGNDRDPPTGWTWEQVARKRALKNALNLSHGAPSPREIAELSWETTNGVKTLPADWEGAEELTSHEAERLAELRALGREQEERWEAMPPEQQQAQAKRNSAILYGSDTDDPFGEVIDATPAPVWDEATVVAGEDDEPEPESRKEPATPKAKAETKPEPAGNGDGELGIYTQDELKRTIAGLLDAVNGATDDHYTSTAHLFNAAKKLHEGNFSWPHPHDAEAWETVKAELVQYADESDSDD